MVHEYTISGMHCAACVQKVRDALVRLAEVESADISLQPPQATIEMRSHISVEDLNSALQKIGAYSLSQSTHSQPIPQNNLASEENNDVTIKTYYPLLLVFAFLIGTATLETITSTVPGVTWWMSKFMGGFFLTFSFFKMLDLKGFAKSYSSYDIITKRWLTFGYIYPFIELALGIGYLLLPMNLILNITTALIMSVSIAGVIESVTNKRKIKCACLGTVFNLPMGTITIIEDALMIAMSISMIILDLS